MKFVLLFIISISSASTLADDIVQRLINPINQLEIGHCGESPNITNQCSKGIKKFYKKVRGRVIYKAFHKGRSPYETCESKKIERDTSLQNFSPTKYNQFLGKNLSVSAWDPITGLQKCIDNRALTDNELKDLSLIYHYRTEHLNQNGVQLLNAINEIDFITGQKKGFNQISCEEDLSFTHTESCQKLKSCAPQDDQIDQMHKLTLTTIKELKRLQLVLLEQNKILAELRKKHHRKGGSSGDERKRGISRFNQILKFRSEIKDTMRLLQEGTPWLKGKHFKRTLKDYEKNEAYQKDSPDSEKIKLVKQKNYEKDIKLKFLRQVNETRENLLNKYGRIKEAGECINGRGRCSRYKKIKKDLLPFNNSLISNPKVAQEIEYVSCIEKEDNKAEVINSVVKTTAEVGVGFALGGVGGVARLSLLASRMLVKGQRLKAIGSAGMLAAGAVAVHSMYDSVLKSCKNSSKLVSGLNNSPISPQCQANIKTSEYSDYGSCITSITTLIVTGGLAIKGQALTKLLRKGDKNAIQFANIGLKGSADEISEFSKFTKNLTPDERGYVSKIISKRFTEGKAVDTSAISDITYYANRLSLKKRKVFLKNLGDGVESKDTIKFAKILEKHQKNQTKLYNDLYKKYKPTLGKKAAKDKAKLEAAKRQEKIRSTSLGCRSKAITPQHIKAGKKFGAITVGLGVGSTAVGFSMANNDKDKNAEWFGKLGYEVSMAYLFSKIGVKIMKNPSTSIAGKYAQGNINAAFVSGIDAAVYGKIFNIDENDAIDRLNRIKLDPEKSEALAKLDHYIEDNNLIEGFKKTVVNNYRGMIQSQKEFADLGRTPFKIGDEDFDEPITEEMLSDPNFQNKLIKATLNEMYDEERGYLDFGNQSVDRWMYDRGYNAAIGVPKGLALSLPIYYALCMTEAYPKRGMAAAIGIQASNQLWSGQFYYENRENLVNQ